MYLYGRQKDLRKAYARLDKNSTEDNTLSTFMEGIRICEKLKPV
jgi:hypothetical protein